MIKINTETKIEDCVNKIVCADCFDFLKLIPNEYVDEIITDPPFNTGLTATESTTRRMKKFFNDTYTDDEYKELAFNTMSELYRVLKADRPVYVCINWKQLGLWLEATKVAKFNVKNVIVWDKVIHGLNYQNYSYTHEFIIYATKGNWSPNNRTDNDRKNRWCEDVWRVQRETGSIDDFNHHETIKPEELISIPILHGSNENDIIFDPFAGSFTTAKCCQKLKRNFISCELDEENCKIGDVRLAQQTLI